jgi:hypothetical protein
MSNILDLKFGAYPEESFIVKEGADNLKNDFEPRTLLNTHLFKGVRQDFPLGIPDYDCSRSEESYRNGREGGPISCSSFGIIFLLPGKHCSIFGLYGVCANRFRWGATSIPAIGYITIVQGTDFLG